MEDFDDSEDKKPKKKGKKWKEEELDNDILPEKGLYDLDGHLFYHASVLPMTKAQYKRAEDHGLNLRSRKNFTLEESIQIFKNWEKFAEENNVLIDKATEYINAKKKDKHLIQHQEEHHFWPKLCEGLPHRSGNRIKVRAETMMTEEFMKSLDWSKLAEQVKEKFYNYETYDDLTMQKAQKLMEKGYASSHVADILDLPVTKAVNMGSKLRILEGRDDSTMIHSFYESAVYFGLNPEKLRQGIILNDDYRLDKLRKHVRYEELSFKLHISEQRCKELLKTVMKRISSKLKEKLEEGETEDEAWEAALETVSSNPTIEKTQVYKALEIFCQHVEKDDTSASLRQNRSLARLLKSNGITGFQCDKPEYEYLHYRVCLGMMVPLERDFFQHLSRDFRMQLKLHCLLWSYKRLGVWEKMSVGTGQTRYEVVLQSEISNPLVSKMTLKFLKNEQVVEWIMEPRPPIHRRNAATRLLEASVESFILYTYQKYSGFFKFPAKLRYLCSSSHTIDTLLSEISDSKNSEYLSIRKVKKTVEDVSGSKIACKIRNKAIIVKKEDSEESEDSEDDSEDVRKHLLEHSRLIETQRAEERRREIDNILEKADPSKIRRKFRNMEEEEEIWLSKELYRQKLAMDRAVQAQHGKFTSKAFIEESDSDSDDDEKAKETEDVEEEDVRSERTFSSEESDKEDVEALDDTENAEERNSEIFENPDGEEDITSSNILEEPEDVTEETQASEVNSKKKKQDHRNSENSENPEDVVGDSEDVTEKKKKKKRKHNDSEILETSEVTETADDVEGSEEVPTKNKKKRKHWDSEVPESSEVVADDSEDAKAEKKKKKRKHRDSENPGPSSNASEFLEVPEDVVEDSEDVSIRKHRDSENSENPNRPEHSEDLEAVVDDSKDVSMNKKNKKKREHKDSGNPEVPEAVAEDSEDDPTEKKKKKKRKHRDSENTEEVTTTKHKKKRRDSEDIPDDVTMEPSESSEVVVEKTKKHKKKKKKNRESLED